MIIQNLVKILKRGVNPGAMGERKNFLEGKSMILKERQEAALKMRERRKES